jgi:hypothetical protein
MHASLPLPTKLNSMKKSVSDSRCCAERNMLSDHIRLAQKRGVSAHSIVSWVRRKYGTKIVIWRELANGQMGCSVPCVICSKWLQRFDLRITCIGPDTKWWTGYVTDPDAPKSKLTSKQSQTMLKNTAHA